VSDYKKDLDADLAAFKAKVKAEEVKLVGESKTLWQKYPGRICLALCVIAALVILAILW
jgi:hypothetical protein